MVSILVFQAHTRKTITEHLRRNASQCRRIALCHHLKHLGSREPTTFLLIFRHTEASEEHILQQRLAIIFLVLTLQFLFFLLVQIVTLSIQYFLFQLGIELLMLQSLIRYELPYLHTEKTAASRHIAQNLSAIGRTDERGQTRLRNIPQTFSTINRDRQHL